MIVGNVDDRYAEGARHDGFEVVSIAAAVRRADVLLVLVPDEIQQAVYRTEIETAPARRPSARLRQRLRGALRPDPAAAVRRRGAVRPRLPRRDRAPPLRGGQGHLRFVRACIRTRRGMRATSRWRWPLGMGWLRFGSVECSFADEVAVNLFAETAGLSAVATLLLTAYEVLVEAGFSAEKAYSETFYELQFVAESITQGRLGDTAGSPTAVYLGLTQTGKIIDDEVRDKHAQDAAPGAERRAGARLEPGAVGRPPLLTQLKRELAEHDISHVEALFLERKQATGW